MESGANRVHMEAWEGSEIAQVRARKLEQTGYPWRPGKVVE